MTMKTLLHVQNNFSKVRCRQASLVCSKYIWRAIPGKFGYFYSHLTLKRVFPALKLMQNYYMNINIIFY